MMGAWLSKHKLDAGMITGSHHFQAARPRSSFFIPKTFDISGRAEMMGAWLSKHKLDAAMITGSDT